MIHNRQLFSSPFVVGKPALRRVSELSNLSVLSVKRRAYSLSESYSYCERMVQMRHDSLPVAFATFQSKRPHGVRGLRLCPRRR